MIGTCPVVKANEGLVDLPRHADGDCLGDLVVDYRHTEVLRAGSVDGDGVEASEGR